MSDSDDDLPTIHTKVNINVLYNKYKDKYIKNPRSRKLIMFYNVIDDNKSCVDIDDEKKSSMARKLERGCYNACKGICAANNIKSSWKNKEFLSTYDVKCYELYKALDSTIENTAYVPRLINNILNDNVDPEGLGALDAIVLNPKRTANAIEIRERSKGTAMIILKGSSCRTCICGSSNTRTKQTQDRSLDESSSEKIICLECGNVWKA